MLLHSLIKVVESTVLCFRSVTRRSDYATLVFEVKIDRFGDSISTFRRWDLKFEFGNILGLLFAGDPIGNAQMFLCTRSRAGLARAGNFRTESNKI